MIAEVGTLGLHGTVRDSRRHLALGGNLERLVVPLHGEHQLLQSLGQKCRTVQGLNDKDEAVAPLGRIVAGDEPGRNDYEPFGKVGGELVHHVVERFLPFAVAILEVADLIVLLIRRQQHGVVERDGHTGETEVQKFLLGSGRSPDDVNEFVVAAGSHQLGLHVFGILALLGMSDIIAEPLELGFVDSVEIGQELRTDRLIEHETKSEGIPFIGH